MSEKKRILKKRRHVIFLIHGIRTQGEWTTRAAEVLESDPTIRVRPISYEFFDLIRFLVPLDRFRNKAVSRVTRLIRDELTRNPDALSVIAHSFGSYIIGKILENEPDIKFHRLLFCGSILRDDFDWGRVGHRLHSESDDSWQVVNECGMQDIWPVMAKSVTWGYGSSGRFGFGHPRVKDRFYNVGHSGFFDEEFVRKRWLPYFVDGEIVQGVLDRPTTPWWVSVLTVAKIRYLVLLVILGLGGWGIADRLSDIWIKSPSVEKEQKEEVRIIELKRELEILIIHFERIDTSREYSIRIIRKEAPIVAKKILNIVPDENILLGHRITKYEYAAYAYMMAASVETDSSSIDFYINEGIKAGERTLELITTAKENASNSDYNKNVYNWMVNEREEDRTKYILAVLYAAKSKKNHSTVGFSKIEELLESISPIYLEEFPIEADRHLRWYINQKTKNREEEK